MIRLDLRLLAPILPLAVACGGGGGDGADDTDSDVVVGENHAPGRPVVAVEPADAVTGDALTVTHEATDADGDELTYAVRWTTDATDVTFDARAESIPADVVVRGQTWTVSVTASDGELESRVAKATITIGNAPPVVDRFSWGPAAPRGIDTLTASGSGTDPEGDNVVVSYRWEVNGRNVSEGRNATTLAPVDVNGAAQFVKGDTVVVTLLLDDRNGGTTEQASDPIVIGNTAPPPPAVRMTPRLAKVRDTLSCTVTMAPGVVDLDGDALTYEVTWLRDGTPLTPVPATLGVPVTQVANTGTVWACTARADDGTDPSVPAYAAVTLGADPPDVSELALGRTFSCASRDDGHTACWGLDGATKRTHPPDVAFGALATGDTWACGVREDDGGLQCWGEAQGAANPPEGVYARIDAAGDYACAQAIDSSLTCWKRGQATLGDALTPPEGGWRTFGVGYAHGCAVANDGTVSCWGPVGSPVLDVPEGTFLTLSANGGHTCALADDRSLACWGDAADGQTAAPAGAFRAVAAGWSHTCAIADDRSLVCWGNDDLGQSSPPPGEYEDVWAGVSHSCARDTDGAVVCWGATDGGLLEIPWGTVAQIDVGAEHACVIDDAGLARCFGTGIADETAAPWGDFVSIDVYTTHVCGLTSTGDALCWGSNTYGQSSPPPGPWDAVAAGFDFSCGIHSGSQQAECWGNPGLAQPLLGATLLTTEPTDRASVITAGDTSACILKLDGKVDCWGTGGGASNLVFTAIASGSTYSCGVVDDGTAKCWGLLAPGNRPGPFTDISVGPSTTGTGFVCALEEDGGILCWGGLTGSPSPEGTGYTALSVGDGVVCALDGDDRPWCWGAWGRQPLDAGL